MSRRDTRLPARRRRTLGAVVAGAAALVLGGCAQDAPQDTWQPAGDNAQKIHDLQWPVFLVAGVIGVIVLAVVAFAVVRFRDRGQPMPEQSHGKPALEIALTILPALILVGVGIPTVSTVFDLAEEADTECIINVTGQQWWWEYDYPVQDGCGGISAPIVTSGQLVIPADTNV
ncbi:MAG: cytochrome c oxidase subunit II transmembrane domain-containing protein, partial [Ilumatobacteraceae bacterium]